ncbi:hypothetical protein ABIE41_001524 [Bosea sp. OAE506]
MSGPRYALYYAPAVDSALWRFGCGTLGYDAFSGEEMAFSVPHGCDPQLWPELTAEPRRYGFHATLKAPFELAGGRNEGELRAFARQIALGCTAVPLAGLKVTSLGRFVALTPSEPSPGAAGAGLRHRPGLRAVSRSARTGRSGTAPRQPADTGRAGPPRRLWLPLCR